MLRLPLAGAQSPFIFFSAFEALLILGRARDLSVASMSTCEEGLKAPCTGSASPKGHPERDSICGRPVSEDDSRGSSVARFGSIRQQDGSRGYRASGTSALGRDGSWPTYPSAEQILQVAAGNRYANRCAALNCAMHTSKDCVASFRCHGQEAACELTQSCRSRLQRSTPRLPPALASAFGRRWVLLRASSGALRKTRAPETRTATGPDAP